MIKFNALYRFSVFTTDADGNHDTKIFPNTWVSFDEISLEAAQREAWFKALEHMQIKIATEGDLSAVDARPASIEIIEVTFVRAAGGKE